MDELNTHPFTINLDDNEDILTKRDLAKRILKAREQKRSELQSQMTVVEAEVEKWGRTYAYLKTLVPDDVGPPEDIGGDTPEQPQPLSQAEEKAAVVDDGPSLVELAEGVVNREPRPIRAREVTNILQAEGHDVTAMAVRNALYYAAHRVNRIKSVPGRGLYAPLAYVGSRDNGQPLGQLEGVQAG